MHNVAFSNGTSVPNLGQGTWNMGEDPGKRAAEIATIRAGVERGLRVVDTAEMYGDGSTEQFLGEALAGLRDNVFLVSKVYPHNAEGRRLVAACEASLKRLKTDHLDLYLLHWRGRVPLRETVQGMRALEAAGKIRAWGVSNLDLDDLSELFAAGGESCFCNQILYNLSRRGPEFSLMPWLETHHIPVMAYSPIEQGRLAAAPVLRRLAARRGMTPLQIALAWVSRNPNVIAIPKASTTAHLKQNIEAVAIALDDFELAELDAAFPPPRLKLGLEML